MSLRKKLALFVIISTFTYTIIIVFIVQFILINEIDSLETEKQKSNMERIESAITARMDSLSRFASDYASWDDTYAFIETKNQTYIDINMIDTTFITSGIELVAFVNTADELIYAKAFDIEQKQSIHFPEELESAIKTSPILTTYKDLDTNVKGFINTRNGILMLVSSPILTSAREGPVKGSLILGTFMNKLELDKLHAITRSDFGIVPTSASYTLPQEAYTNDIYVGSSDSKSLTGYKQFNDIFGKPVFTAVLTSEKGFLAHTLRSTRLVTVMLMIIGVTTILIGLLIIEAIAVRPIKNLAKAVQTITVNGDLSARLKQSGGQEVVSLTSDINKLIENVSVSEKKLKDSNTTLTQKSEQLEKINKLMINRELKMIQLKGDVENLKEQLNDRS